jgi:hypothetical protein
MKVSFFTLHDAWNFKWNMIFKDTVIIISSIHYLGNKNVDNAFTDKDHNIYNMLGMNKEVNIRFSTTSSRIFAYLYLRLFHSLVRKFFSLKFRTQLIATFDVHLECSAARHGAERLQRRIDITVSYWRHRRHW